MNIENTVALRAHIARRLAEEDVVLGQLYSLGLSMVVVLGSRSATASVCGVVATAPTLTEAASVALALILVPEVEA